MWLRRYCCCCCFCCPSCAPSDVVGKPTGDSSSLIGGQQEEEEHQGTTPLSQEHAFYVPRRHSSFMPSACYNSTSAHPERRPQSDECSSSSDEDGAGEGQRRGRCWSTVPALDATLAAHGFPTRDTTDTTSRANRASIDNAVDLPSNCAALAFDKRVLGEIAEAGPGEEPPTAGGFHAHRADTEVYGYLTFATLYERQEQRLTVFLNRATGLPSKGEEPYGTFVKMNLVATPPSGSNGHHSRTSRTVKKCLDPVYAEKHVFHTNRSKWRSASRPPLPYLRLSVIDSERQGRHDAIGHALLPLDEVGGEKQEHRLPLTPMSLPSPNLGQVLIGLQYVPTQSRLAVHVIKARHLRLDPELHKRHLRPFNTRAEMLDSFCKVTLTCGGQKVKSCRSRPVSGRDPFFDFRSSFVVPPQYLRDTGTVVGVVARSTLGRQGATLGRATVLGPYVETGDGRATQWGRMILEGRSVVQWRSIYL